MYFIMKKGKNPNRKDQCNRDISVWLNTGEAIINRGNQTSQIMTLVSFISGCPWQLSNNQSPPMITVNEWVRQDYLAASSFLLSPVFFRQSIIVTFVSPEQKWL